MKLNKFLLSIAFAGLSFPLYMCQPSSPKIEAQEANLKNHVKNLSSDEFLGRMPFTKGEEITLDYLVEEFAKAGATPGYNGSWFQEVPMVEINSKLQSDLVITGENGALNLEQGKDFVALSRRVADSIDLTNSPLVFAGYGVVSREYKWNDYITRDFKGKTAVVLVNDPGFGMGDTSFFKGNTMTYYGRWTYKFEEAARQDADGILIVHKTIPAGYPWGVVENGWTGPQLYLESATGNLGRCKVEGWISYDAFLKMLDAAGMDPSIIAEAKKPGFKPVKMGLDCSVSMKNEMKHSKSKNVVALIEGEKPLESIIYSAHWDHLGVGKPIDGDSIYNGAVDNATGTAALLEMARMFGEGPKPKRSVVMLAVTAEEQGLLGSDYWCENSVYAHTLTVANLNMDALSVLGPMKDLTIVGYGQSELEDIAGEIAEKQGRYVIPDPEPGKGYFFRSDHFNFAKRGIPALYCEGGYDHAEKGKEYAEEARLDYLTNRYHKPQDEYNPDGDYRGMVQDVNLFYQIGYRLANSEEWPEWKKGSEFREIRERQRPSRENQ